jgi:hypothetical protein
MTFQNNIIPQDAFARWCNIRIGGMVDMKPSKTLVMLTANEITARLISNLLAGGIKTIDTSELLLFAATKMHAEHHASSSTLAYAAKDLDVEVRNLHSKCRMPRTEQGVPGWLIRNIGFLEKGESSSVKYYSTMFCIVAYCIDVLCGEIKDVSTGAVMSVAELLDRTEKSRVPSIAMIKREDEIEIVELEPGSIDDVDGNGWVVSDE